MLFPSAYSRSKKPLKPKLLEKNTKKDIDDDYYNDEYDDFDITTTTTTTTTTKKPKKNHHKKKKIKTTTRRTTTATTTTQKPTKKTLRIENLNKNSNKNDKTLETNYENVDRFIQDVDMLNDDKTDSTIVLKAVENNQTNETQIRNELEQLYELLTELDSLQQRHNQNQTVLID